MRIKSIELATGDELVCQLLMSKQDLDAFPSLCLFGKHEIVNPVTFEPCILVNNPAKLISQLNIQTGETYLYLIPWSPQSRTTVFTIPIRLIVNTSSIRDIMESRYQDFLNGPSESEEEILKFMCPEHPETH